MKRLLHALAAATLLCAALDAHTEPLPTASDKIAVGAYQVQVASAGSGRYTVIFESGFGTDLRAWRKVAADVPVVVISSMQTVEKPEFFLETAPARGVLFGLHDDFAKSFREGRHVVTERSGHNIQLEEPQLVIDAVQQVIALASKR